MTRVPSFSLAETQKIEFSKIPIMLANNGPATQMKLNEPRPNDIGILALEAYIPKRYVSQSDLEEFDGVSSGKYTIGLGQTNMAVLDDRHDINSISLSGMRYTFL
jgi:hypothetical protein